MKSWPRPCVPPRSWKLRIADILEAIERTDRYTSGMDFEGFSSNEVVVDAVIRNLTTLGEAARNIPDEITLAHSEIPWAQMIGMRNSVVHAYFGIALDVVWDTIQADLPPLIPMLRKLL